jgi:hypothetical protein
MKFQDLAAIVGGFVKIITLIFSFLNFYSNTYERDKFIINYFFNILNGDNGNSNKSSCDNNIEKLKARRILVNENILNEHNYNFADDAKKKPTPKFINKFKHSVNQIIVKQKIKNNATKDVENQVLYAKLGNISRKKLNTDLDNPENFESKKNQNENSNDKNPEGDLNSELSKINIKSKNLTLLNQTGNNTNLLSTNMNNSNYNFIDNIAYSQLNCFPYKNQTENAAFKSSLGNQNLGEFTSMKASKFGNLKDDIISKIVERENENNATIINNKERQEAGLEDKEIINFRRKHGDGII